MRPLVDSFLYGRIVGFDHATAALSEARRLESSHKMGARSAFKGGPGGGPGKHDESADPGKGFFAIRPVRLERAVEGVKAVPITGGPHPDLLKLDEADGYLEMRPFAYRDLKPGDEVEVELRYPYTSL